MDLVPFEPKREEVEGRFVRVCKVCKQPKGKNQFYKEEVNKFDGGDGISEDCRACRMKAARIKHEEWLKRHGWKR